MFGYIRPYRPYLREYEYEIYRGFYCGLCKDLGKNYGQIFRFFLSYDFTFLSLMCCSLSGNESIMKRQHCIAHPVKKRYCVCCGNDFDYTSAAAVISVYHKVCDEIADRGAVSGLFFRLLRKVMTKAYKKAARKLPVVAERVEYYMKMQGEIEQSRCTSIDMACEPTAQIMSVITENITDSSDQERRKHLNRFGYHLGRFIYIADAHDDLEKDIKHHNYNPLSLNYENIDSAKEFAVQNINMSLGQAAEAYLKCGFSKFRDILDNVVYLGLPKFRDFKRTKKKKEIKI